VLEGWEDGGCLEEIDRRLGYRWWVSEVAHTDAVRPGGTLLIKFRVVNTGWAVNINERPVEVVLGDRVASLSLDTRAWVHDQFIWEEVALHVPADLPEGTYPLALRFPDPLSDEPDSFVQLANQTPWDGVDNWVVEAIVVDDDAKGGPESDDVVFGEVSWPTWVP
jgi:hypothetical protein